MVLGDLNAKLTDDVDRRLEMIIVIEAYYIDFLTRIKDYGVVQNIDIPEISNCENEQNGNGTLKVMHNETRPDLRKMNSEREGKIKRYKEKKELESQLKELKALVDVKNEHRDEEAIRKYYITLIHSFVLSTLQELSSYEMEKPILHHMAKVRQGEIPDTKQAVPYPKRPLKPIVITRDAVQKEVFGMGYKHLPILTIEEFYEQRVRDGWFPSPDETKKQRSLLDRTMGTTEELKAQEEEEAR